MPSSDPVGDMLAMIKNAYGRRHKRISLTHSRLKEGVAKVLRGEGYSAGFAIDTDCLMGRKSYEVGFTCPLVGIPAPFN